MGLLSRGVEENKVRILEWRNKRNNTNYQNKGLRQKRRHSRGPLRRCMCSGDSGDSEYWLPKHRCQLFPFGFRDTSPPTSPTTINIIRYFG